MSSTDESTWQEERDIVPLKATTFSNIKLRDDEENRVQPILEAFRAGKLGKDVGSMVRSIMAFRPRGRSKGRRKVVAMTGPSVPPRTDSEHRYTAIQGSDDAFFDRVDQRVYAGPENTASFLVEVASSGDTASGLEAVIEEAIKEAEETASEIIRSQPHRNFMRCLFATGDGKVCQVQFDRGGAAYTHPLSIHSDPETFIRLVLNSTSRDVHILGVGALPRFEKRDGVKVTGTITLKNESGESTPYEMDVKPMYVERNRGLVARATMCFRLRNDDGEFVLKSAWRTPESRSKEYSKLERAKGIKGVVQMVSWDDSLTTDMLRGFSEAKWSTSDHSNDVPIAHRVLILMECTGPPIYKFTSERQLIEACLDIVAGLRELYSKANLMHGDISVNNVVLGRPGAPEGERGKLIDLDMAIDADSEHMSWQGTMPYMSMSTMRRALTQQGLVDPDYSPQLACHEPMDDGESFFYVFFDVTFSMNGPSPTQPPLPDLLAPTDLKEAYDAKAALYRDTPKYDLDTLPPYWSHPTRVLFQRFYQLIRDIAEHKRSLARGLHVKEGEYAAYKTHAPLYLAAIQGYFEDAVAELAAMDDTPPSSPGSPTVRSVTSSSPFSEHALAPRTPELSASRHDLRSPLQPRVDDNYDVAVVPAEVKASPPRLGNGKRKASGNDLENQPLPVKQRN